MSEFMKDLLDHPLEEQGFIIRKAVEGLTKSWQGDNCISAKLSSSKDEIEIWYSKIFLKEIKLQLGEGK